MYTRIQSMYAYSHVFLNGICRYSSIYTAQRIRRQSTKVIVLPHACLKVGLSQIHVRAFQELGILL